MEVMQKELDSAESDLKELTVLNDMIEAQAINTILYKIKQSCDTANGFILDEEFYICVNNQKSKPNTDKEHTEPKEEYRL